MIVYDVTTELTVSSASEWLKELNQVFKNLPIKPLSLIALSRSQGAFTFAPTRRLPAAVAFVR